MVAKSPKFDKAKELFWRKAIARQAESGLPQARFCERDGLNANNFSWWKREISKRDAARAEIVSAPSMDDLFIPLNVKSETDSKVDTEKAVAEIDLSAGIVRIFGGIDRHALHEILSVLREVTR